jgi:hypothetical protein
MKKNETIPLIIVFYLDAEMMQVKEIIQPFAESVNTMLAHKNANAMAFFIPTKGAERVECINPSIVSEADMSKINEMVEDIKKSFSIGEDINIEDDDIEMTDEEIVKEITKMTDILNEKPCDCGNNPNGNCKCDE